MTARARALVRELRLHARPENLPGMARYGIATDRALGVSIPVLRAMAKRTGRDHALAMELWSTGVHEARILAGMLADPVRMTSRDMDAWVRDLDSWDLCDQCCANVFERSPRAYRKCDVWSRRSATFVKRSAFSLMARLAVSDKGAADAPFEHFLTIIEREAADGRNYVRKGISWALRQIGKRNPRLRRRALAVARRLRAGDSAGARWVGSDAERELRRG